MTRIQWMLLVGLGCLVLAVQQLGQWAVVQHTADDVLVGPRHAIVVASQQLLLPARPLHEWLFSVQRNRWLSQQLAQLQVDQSELDRLRQENEYLRSLLQDRAVVFQVRQIMAPVTGFGMPAVWLGAQAAVTPNSLVSVNGVLLGKIHTINGATAQVALLSEESGWQVLAQTQTGITGVVSGNNGRVRLTQVPASAVVRVGERVVTAGQPNVPPNMLIGVVASIDPHDPAAATQSIVLDQFVSFYQSPLVEVTQEAGAP